jgi:nitroreductase
LILTNLRQDARAAKPQAPAAEVRDLLDKLAMRASCRDFDSSMIAPETLEDIVRDGVEAPSSCNQQNWHFIIVADPVRKERARDISGGNHHFAECSALIYLCFQKGWTHGNFSIVQSVAGACYHMMLSAHLRGFQCIWNAGIGDQAALREMIGLPQTFDVIGALAIGRAKSTAPKMKAPRRPVPGQTGRYLSVLGN